MNQDCIFCKIAAGIEPCHKIWENDDFLAFLSIFPNTEGFTIVIPKKHYPSYCFDLPNDIFSALVIHSKEVAKLLDLKFEDVGKTGMILEGMGVDHAHTKLFPMHGTAKLKKWKPIISHVDKYFDEYEGYISSHDFVRADDKELDKLAKKLSS